MNDLAFDLLLPLLQEPSGKSLWLVDEAVTANEIRKVAPHPLVDVITNRYDLWMLFKQRGFSASPEDFELTQDRSHYDCVLHRLSKDKALVHYIINASSQCLHKDGQLILSGFKNEGIKTYTSKAAAYFGGTLETERGKKTAQMARIYRDQSVGGLLDDKQYASMRKIIDGDTAFYSKPGIFGWQKVDVGSRFLIENLLEVVAQFDAPVRSVLDLGCGYGYLTMKAAELLSASFTAVDNNITAVTAAGKNLQYYSVNGQASCDDCGSLLKQRYDLILCNPPFHQGFGIESDLGLKFLTAARRLLAPGGRAIFVVNSFIPLERKAASLYDSVKLVANNNSFKVVLMVR